MQMAQMVELQEWFEQSVKLYIMVSQNVTDGFSWLWEYP